MKINFFERILNRRWVITGIMFIALMFTVIVYAASVTKPHTFVDDTIISAQEMNENFDTIYSKINGLVLTCACYSNSSTVTTGQNSVSMQLPDSTYVLTGGGCQESTLTERQLTASYPSGTNEWTCKSTDEDNSFAGTLTAYVCGCLVE